MLTIDFIDQIYFPSFTQEKFEAKKIQLDVRDVRGYKIILDASPSP